MSKSALSLLLCSALLLTADDFGPLEATIQHPARLQFYAPYPESCAIDSGATDWTFSSAKTFHPLKTLPTLRSA